MNISVCSPTLNRYDLVKKMVESGKNGTLKPTSYYIIDNGGKLDFEDELVTVVRPGRNLGVGPSWNWFMKNVPDIRIIVNDDVEFFPDTIEKLVDAYTKNTTDYLFYPAGAMSGNMFSLFIITDRCRDLVGYFDDRFYPAYFEDNDYYYRMSLLNLTATGVPDCNYTHVASATLKNYTSLETSRHHETFKINKSLYIKKWGGEPGHEVFITPQV